MKRIHYGMWMILFILLLFGCSSDNDIKESPELSNENNNEKNGKDEVGEIDIYDFYFINRAPLAEKKHPLEELIKIYYSSKGVAIDLKNNEIYAEPQFSTNGIATFEEPLEFHDQEELLEILEKYNVQEWKEDYTTEDPDSYQDGFGWMMFLQFEDGTVEKYRGSGSFKKDVVPENFDEFAEEMEAFKKKVVESEEKQQ